jgi:hypothetical protein
MKKYRICRPDDGTLLRVVEGPDDAIAAVLSYATCSEAAVAGEDWTPEVEREYGHKIVRDGDYFFEGFARIQTADRDLAHLRRLVESEEPPRGHVTVGVEEHVWLGSGARTTA